MRLSCRFSFTLPQGKELLFQRSMDSSPQEVQFSTEHENVVVLLPLPAESALRFDGTPRKVAWNDKERTEVLELGSFSVHVSTGVELNEPDQEAAKEIRHKKAMELEPTVLDVASRFLEATRWRTGQFWLPQRLSRQDADATIQFFLDEKRVPESMARITAVLPDPSRALTLDSSRTISDDLKASRLPPLGEVLLLDAQHYQRLGDHRVALILAAMSLETTLLAELRWRLERADMATTSQIDRFLDEMSNRLLAAVVMGLLDIGDKAFRERCRRVFEARNTIVHGKRKQPVQRQTSTMAVNVAKEMLEFASAPT